MKKLNLMKSKIKKPNNRKPIKKLNIPALFRTVMMVVLIVLIVALPFLMYRTWKYPGSITEKESLYAYSQKAVVDYQVAYKNNILTGANTAPAGETYIAEYINNIQTTFNYEFNGEKPAEYKGQYEIKATLIGNKKEQDKVITIWKKEYQLLPSTPFSGTEASFKLSKELPINLKTYNDFVEKFSEETKINSDTDLLVSWNVTLEANTAHGVIAENLTPTLIIPINRSYFNISGEQKKEQKGAQEESFTRVLPVNQPALYLYGIIAVLSLLGLLGLIIFTKGIRVTDPLELRMKEIFKKHGERLVALGSEANLNENMPVPVKTLEDLIKIADELCKPVMYKVTPNHESDPVFYVFDDPKVYIFELKIESEEKPFAKDAINLLQVGLVEGKGEEI